MARVHTAKAAKDYPENGIVKGDTYFFWQLYKQPRQMSKTPPRQSQLTGSVKLSQVYAAVELLADRIAAATSTDDLVEALNDCASDINDVAEEYRDSASAMESVFPSGCPTMYMCNESADELESFASELESSAEGINALDPSEYAEDERKVNNPGDLEPQEYENMLEEARGIASEPECPL